MCVFFVYCVRLFLECFAHVAFSCFDTLVVNQSESQATLCPCEQKLLLHMMKVRASFRDQVKMCPDEKDF